VAVVMTTAVLVWVGGGVYGFQRGIGWDPARVLQVHLGCAASPPLTARDKVEAIVEECSGRENLCIHGITWDIGRIEVTLRENVGPDSDAVIGPSIDAINAVHTRLAEAMELDPEMEALLVKNEVLLASPGVGEDLYRDIDFLVFKGFPVTVTTTELYKKMTCFEGTLMERTDEYVSVSLKGRIVKVPRNVIDKVSLPTPKFEEADDEMRKLRR